MPNNYQPHELVLQLEGQCWATKDVCNDLAMRSISQADEAKLASVSRDLQRLHDTLVAIRDKRKRSKATDDEQVADLPQAEVDDLIDSVTAPNEGRVVRHG